MDEHRPAGMSGRAAAVGFPDAVREQFVFLVNEMGFLGPEYSSDGAAFSSPNISFEIHYDKLERNVTTFARGMVGEHQVYAELSCLYVQAGIGPAQHVGISARTRHALRKTLAAQAAAVRELLPWLRGEARDDLLLSCHGR
jgi:hypothetical protein